MIYKHAILIFALVASCTQINAMNYGCVDDNSGRLEAIVKHVDQEGVLASKLNSRDGKSFACVNKACYAYIVKNKGKLLPKQSIAYTDDMYIDEEFVPVLSDDDAGIGMDLSQDEKDAREIQNLNLSDAECSYLTETGYPTAQWKWYASINRAIIDAIKARDYNKIESLLGSPYIDLFYVKEKDTTAYSIAANMQYKEIVFLLDNYNNNKYRPNDYNQQPDNSPSNSRFTDTTTLIENPPRENVYYLSKNVHNQIIETSYESPISRDFMDQLQKMQKELNKMCISENKSDNAGPEKLTIESRRELLEYINKFGSKNAPEWLAVRRNNTARTIYAFTCGYRQCFHRITLDEDGALEDRTAFVKYSEPCGDNYHYKQGAVDCWIPRPCIDQYNTARTYYFQKNEVVGTMDTIEVSIGEQGTNHLFCFFSLGDDTKYPFIYLRGTSYLDRFLKSKKTYTEDNQKTFRDIGVTINHKPFAEKNKKEIKAIIEKINTA